MEQPEFTLPFPQPACGERFSLSSWLEQGRALAWAAPGQHWRRRCLRKAWKNQPIKAGLSHWGVEAVKSHSCNITNKPRTGRDSIKLFQGQARPHSPASRQGKVSGHRGTKGKVHRLAGRARSRACTGNSVSTSWWGTRNTGPKTTWNPSSCSQ